jgi:N-acetylglucosamine-6-phosphate deacetylase
MTAGDDPVTLRGRLDGDGPVCDVTLRDGRIAAIGPAADGPVDAGGPDRLLLPPLLDLQHNGGLGRAFNDPSATLDDLRRLRAFTLSHGTARLLATLITAPLDRLAAALARLVSARRSDPDLAAWLPGFHIEGPWISAKDGFRGAHNPDWMRDPAYDDFRRLQDAAEGLIRIVTLAPERPGAIAFIERLAADGVIVSLAHADPDDACVREAVDAGARMVTHFGNGMAATIHRHRNPLWSYLAEPRLACGLIADGFHLPGAVMRAALAAKGAGGVFLVSDAGHLAGLPPGAYPDGHQTLVIEPNGYLHIQGSEYLAGAWFQLDHCVGVAARELALSPAAAWRLGSTVPADIAGMASSRPLALGGPADVVVARWDDAPRIEAVYLSGARRFPER